jgi:hypothetical protein
MIVRTRVTLLSSATEEEVNTVRYVDLCSWLGLLCISFVKLLAKKHNSYAKEWHLLLLVSVDLNTMSVPCALPVIVRAIICLTATIKAVIVW